MLFRSYLTTYCYMPRLANLSVLESTIKAGVASDESFAIASSMNGERYVGLRYKVAVSDVYPSDYIVKDLIALKQINSDRQNPTTSGEPENPGGNNPIQPEGPGGVQVPPVATQESNTHFFMSVKLDNTRVIRDLQKYLDEVITHLSSIDDCTVNLSLEVNATVNNGFPQGTVRTVSENCRTLRVEDFGFDK